MAKCKHKNTFIINSRWLDEYKPFFLDEKLFSINTANRLYFIYILYHILVIIVITGQGIHTKRCGHHPPFVIEH
jgi:hypothetical protein